MDDYYAHRRDRLVANMSQAAKHRAFPTVYAKPVPMADAASEARAEIARLKRENAELQATISRLEQELKAATMNPGALYRKQIEAVQVAFLDAYKELGGDLNGRPYTALDFISPRRSQAVSWPRQVCMDLVRRLTPASYPQIGHAFGGKDHTTVMCAIKRTPHHLAECETLAATHAKVLAVFDAQRASQ